MQIFDSHVHLFNQRIIENVSSRTELVERVQLKTRGADQRLTIDALKRSLADSGVTGGLVLPTAGPADVAKINDRFYDVVLEHPFLITAGTLHPEDPTTGEEIKKLNSRGTRVVKMCSFSQGFVLDGQRTLDLFERIQHHNQTHANRLAVVLDTLYRADRWFGTDPAFNTAPAQLRALAQRFPEIDFVGAHMGGLSAPFEDIADSLIPCANLYLDTSNAAHTLSAAEFVFLLKRFGPEHILFGTDWPWFTHAEEIALVEGLCDTAGYSPEEKQAVFYDNIARLLGL